eukprot:1323989-Amphidinium_carterae.1
MVPHKGINTEATKAITRFIVENRLQTAILQSNGEPAILEPLTELGRQLPRVKIQIAPQHNHHSQEVVERYHRTLFAQRRTIKLSRLQH